MTTDLPIPETRVLAVASHVVSGYVGNKIAMFVMQSLGCDVAALNTVQFSNHTGYRQWKGTRVSAQEITDLWEGLKLSCLDDFDMMLSGYIPGAAAVEAVGRIAEELRRKSDSAPGRFFWVLDPVMGDNGNLYVAQDVVPAYKKLLTHADLILPNQFEAELLSGVRIDSLASLHEAVQALHTTYRVPHVVITSVSLAHPDHPVSSLSVVGSTATSTGRARAFKIVFPAIDAYFSGTGDMFAALMVVRIREAVTAAAAAAAVDEDENDNERRGGSSSSSSSSSSSRLTDRRAWVSGDAVAATDLPLARAAERVLASMHEVLSKTAEGMGKEMRGGLDGAVDGGEGVDDDEGKAQLLRSRAAELRLVRNLESLKCPKVEFRAVAM